MISPVVAQTFDSSSIATSTISAPVPVPPYCSSNGRPKSSCSRKSSTRSQGNSAFLSISAARGATPSRASVRTRSRISRCSSVNTSYGTRRSLFATQELEHALERLAHLVRALLHHRVVIRLDQPGGHLVEVDEPADDLVVRVLLDLHRSWKTASTLLPSGSRTKQA